MIAYFYIKKEDIIETCECGLKLSKWFDTEIIIDMFEKKAITAYLTPKDNIKKYNNPNYVCLKLELNSNKLFVVEKIYYELNKKSLYKESLILANKYIVGTYRFPVFVITHTVLGEYISILDKKRDIPVLYDNNEEMYLKAMYSKLEYLDSNFYDKAIYGYLNNSSDYKKVDSESNKYEVFIKDGIKYLLR